MKQIHNKKLTVMPTIHYKKTFFKQPSRINEDVFNTIKRELSKNPTFEIDPSPETFSQHFKGSLKTIKVCGIIIAIGLVLSPLLKDLSEKGDNFDQILGIPALMLLVCFMLLIGAVIHLLLEGTSYATYLKQKTEYFSRMKYGIQNAQSHKEFCISFYGR